MKQYTGAVLVHRAQPFKKISDGLGENIIYDSNGMAAHTFRLQDSIWTETLPYGFFANFNHGDTLK